jgi:EAL and modified HD-GYP domain-containing signal transduction protein
VERSGVVHGYELLFRPTADALTSEVTPLAGDRATSEVLVETFAEFGPEHLVGEALAFVNVTRSFATGALPLPLPADRTVLELLETVIVDDAVVDGLRELRTRGYRIALDDYVPDARRKSLIREGLIDYVKVDITDRDPQELRALAGTVLEPGVRLVAERVETTDQLEQCAQAGFGLFQGFIVGRPGVHSASSLAPSLTSCLTLAAALERPDVGVAEAADLVSHDVGLSYRLLRLANSAAVNPSRRLTSLRDVLVLLGLDAVAAWVLLLGLAAAHPGAQQQALGHALTRGRQCQLVAEHLLRRGTPGRDTGRDPLSPASAFLVGLVSAVDRLLARTLPDVVAQLRLAPSLESALLAHDGPIGAVLSAVLSYEAGRRASHGPQYAVLRRCYLQAAAWADGAQVALSS